MGDPIAMVDGSIGICNLVDRPARRLVRSRVKDKTSPPPRPPPPRAAVGRASPSPSRVDTVYPDGRRESRAVSFRRSATLRRACPPFTENLHANTRRTRYQNIMGEKRRGSKLLVRSTVATGEHLIDLNTLSRSLALSLSRCASRASRLTRFAPHALRASRSRATA